MRLEFLGKKLIAQDIYSFSFASKKRVHYLPGQYLYFTLPGIAKDARGPSREFTISSSPTEIDIQFTTSIVSGSQFKKALTELIPGTLVEADGPHGVFFMDEKTSGNHLFIAGGIGITPFRSMNKFIKDKKLDIKTRLLLFVADQKKQIYYDEFEDKKVIVTNGQKSKLDHTTILKAISGLDNPEVWIAGSDTFVTEIEKILYKLKISQDKINFEKLTRVK